MDIPGIVSDAVLKPSQFDAKNNTSVKGFDFSEGAELDALMQSMLRTGFQATNMGLAIEQINKMLSWRLSDVPVKESDQDEFKSPEYRAKARCTIFLSYTSNLISSGIRETIRFLVQHKLVDAIVTTAGGVEEDIIKCLGDTYLGDFKLKGSELRLQGVNRLGNLLVPNDNYCKFEDWVMPILHTMTDEQVRDGTRWSPSTVIDRLGKEIDNEESVYYWAHKNNIPVFCPALTDGSLGDMMYFHSYKRPEFSVDIVQDIRRINDIAVKAHCSGMVILGGGVVKHHTCNANLMRNGAEYSVYINTGQEFDGSDSGASPDEAVSWGKIRIDAKPVKVCADATLVFPLIVSQTFYKAFLARKAESEAAAASASPA
ncbi:DHS-like NAD/FAD-binding domain-containing protein [Ochromonadaceae sp. CCMP2298]|nr:DHS-like NAD/FAD-binding domain-containing protein [Ochromonadaceae sp. CCMP2298]|mmetsp:Transcript_14189/g.31324  ORF Transcript_14189/g.31324 Transcript_14189/m.31324 type:complete len:372 (-) Transcript_14189:57-1172(-)